MRTASAFFCLAASAALAAAAAYGVTSSSLYGDPTFAQVERLIKTVEDRGMGRAVPESSINGVRLNGTLLPVDAYRIANGTVLSKKDLHEAVTNNVDSGYLCTVATAQTKADAAQAAAIADAAEKYFTSHSPDDEGAPSLYWQGGYILTGTSFNLILPGSVNVTGWDSFHAGNYYENPQSLPSYLNSLAWRTTGNRLLSNYGITNAYTKAEADGRYMQTTDTASFANGAKMLTPEKYPIGSYGKIAFADNDGKTDVPYVRYRNGVTMESVDSYLIPDGTAFATLTSISNTCYTKAESDDKYLPKASSETSFVQWSDELLEIYSSDEGVGGLWAVGDICGYAGTDSLHNKANKAKTLAGYGITNAYTKSETVALIDHTLPHFSNEVLAVGLNIDTNAVAVLNDIAATFGGFPVEGTATTVGGLLAALAAAIAWLKKNKIDKLTCTGVSDITTDNGSADVSALFSRDDTSTEIEIDGLLKNAELEKSVKVCAHKYGGTQIKQDDQGNFYYEVEE